MAHVAIAGYIPEKRWTTEVEPDLMVREEEAPIPYEEEVAREEEAPIPLEEEVAKNDLTEGVKRALSRILIEGLTKRAPGCRAMDWMLGKC